MCIIERIATRIARRGSRPSIPTARQGPRMGADRGAPVAQLSARAAFPIARRSALVGGCAARSPSLRRVSLTRDHRDGFALQLEVRLVQSGLPSQKVP